MRRALSPSLWLRIALHAGLYALLLGWLWAGTAAAAGSMVPAGIAAAVPDARLAGQGSYRWFGLLIYDAELWVGRDGVRNDAATSAMPAPFALSLRYGRALAGRRIADASADEMARQGSGTPAQRDQWREKMRAMFPDVQDGTRLTGIYRPDRGVQFYKDAQLLGSIDDDAFGRAFFAIWLSPSTSAPALRSALLKGAAPGSAATAGEQ
ncbi:chalcone isomerase family protein [Herbaspirillum autotrophicum]|uniref:chalcone isomerase family protein n=1 Tax=Herbaspirillum autotrophicum TaxID=180195 RepID=UPI00067C65D7|nr:chalcone isomerase family protein [Herbaspirillum autotrophicum]